MDVLEPLCILTIFGAFVALIVAIAAAEQKQRQERARRLRDFMRALDDASGEVDRPLGKAWVRGRLDGRAVALTFQVRGGKHKYHVAAFEVEVDAPAVEFEVAEENALDDLWRWLGLSSTERLAAGGDLKVSGGAAARKLLQQAELVREVRALLALPDDRGSVRLRAGRVRFERRVSDGMLVAGELLRTFRRLGEIARHCSRRQVTNIRVRARDADAPRFAWTDGGHTALCPYCREEVREDGEEAAACERCATLHHAACFDEAGGCTIFGCGPRRRERVSG